VNGIQFCEECLHVNAVIPWRQMLPLDSRIRTRRGGSIKLTEVDMIESAN